MNRNKVVTVSILVVCSVVLLGIVYLAANKKQTGHRRQENVLRENNEQNNDVGKNQSLGVVQEALVEETTLTDADTVDFHGRVIDWNNNPVAGAYVCANITSSDQNKKPENILVSTDANGFFNMSGIGQIIDIKTVRKSGYKLSKSKNKMVFRAGDIASEEPTVFYLEKSDGPTMVQSSETFVFWKSKTSEYKFDLTEDSFASMPIQDGKPKPELKSWAMDSKAKEKKEPESGKQNDLSFKAILSDDGLIYNLQIFALDKDGGIIVSEELLKEAPEEGYENQTTIKVDISRGVNKEDKFLYIRSRDSQVYSRLRLDIKAFPENMHVSVSSLTNLEGSRIFEIPFNGRLELEQEIRSEKTNPQNIITRKNRIINQ